MRLIPTMFHQNVRGGDEKMSTPPYRSDKLTIQSRIYASSPFERQNHVLQSAYVVPTQDFVPATKTTGPGFCFLLPLWVYLFYWTVTVSVQKAEIESRSLSRIGMRRAYDLVKIKGTKSTVKFFPPAWLRYHREILLWYGTFSYP